MNITHLPDKNTYQPFAHSQQRFTTASLIVLLMNSINSLCFSPSFSPSVAHVPLFFLFFSPVDFYTSSLSFLPSLSPWAPVEDELLTAVGRRNAEREWSIVVTDNSQESRWWFKLCPFYLVTCLLSLSLSLCLSLACWLYPSPLIELNWNCFFNHHFFVSPLILHHSFFKPGRGESKEMDTETDKEG